MAAITENMFGRSNRRRCVKGRISYTDTSDIIIANDEEKLENDLKDTENHLEYSFNENLDDADEVDEEPVTIDLSEFLNENPLLTEPSENVIDSAGVLTDCHSQFRVTSSLADPSPLKIEAVPTLKDLNINENTAFTEVISTSEPVSEIPPTILTENNAPVDSTNELTRVVNDKSPRKENLLNGIKPSIKNFKSKPPIVSSLLEKYKNFSRLKDFNKNNLKAFGKYPVIRCEKLDIETFVKKSNIKVGNWPLQSVNSQSKNKPDSSKTTISKKSKSSICKGPKLLNKPISFNKGLSNSRNASTVKKAQSILIDALKPNSQSFIIRTDNWKPEIANLSGHSSHFIDTSVENFRMPIPQSFNKTTVNHRVIKLVPHKSPFLKINDLSSQNQKLPIITSVNKIANGPKTFQLISPNTFVAAKTEKNRSMSVTPILPKPSSDSMIAPVIFKDYTVIQPYIEDPTSPVKPKPLLTVPLDIVPVVDTYNQQGTSNSVPEMHQIIKPPTKSSKPIQSVFLNGAVKQISSPVKTSKELPSVNLSVLSHCNTELSASVVEDKIEEQLKGDSSVITPKSVVVDAMENAFSKPQVKKYPKSKHNVSKQNLPHIGLADNSECQTYNSTLNDMLFGLSDIGDFNDENYSLGTNIDISSEVCDSNAIVQSSDVYQSDQKVVLDIQHKASESSEDDHKVNKLFSKCKLRTKAIASPHDSDTLSASEGEEDRNESQLKLSYVSNRKHKISQKTPEKSLNPSIVSEESDIDFSPKKLILGADITENVINQNKRNKFQRRNNNIPIKNSPRLANQSKEKKSESKTLSSSQSFEKSSRSLKSKDDNFQDVSEQNNEENSTSVNKTEKLRGKLRAVQKSKGNVNNSFDKQKSALKYQRRIVPVIKGRRILYVRSRFKIKSKKSRNTKIINKKSSRPSDIIKEINTITGGNLISGKGSRKREKIIPLKETNINNHDLPISKTKNDSKAKTTKQNKKNSSVGPKTKKMKTLKVLFKRSTPKQKTKSPEISFDEICPKLNDKNDSNSLLVNNTNLNSSFRNMKNHKMGTPSEEENKSDVDVLCNEFKPDDSLKENICSKDNILSNGVPLSNVIEDSVSIDNRDSMNFKNCDREENKSDGDVLDLKLDDSSKENFCTKDKVLSNEVPSSNAVEDLGSIEDKDSINFKIFNKEENKSDADVLCNELKPGDSSKENISCKVKILSPGSNAIEDSMSANYRDSVNFKNCGNEIKSDADVLCKELKLDNSLKENICSKDKIVSNIIPDSNVIDSVSAEDRDSMNFKNCCNSDLQEIKITKEHENASKIREKNIDILTKSVNVTSENLGNLCLETKDESDIENPCVPINEPNIVNNLLECTIGITSCKEIRNEDHISNDIVDQPDVKDNLIISSPIEINENTATPDEIRIIDHSSNMMIQGDVKEGVVNVPYKNADEISTSLNEDQKQGNNSDKAFETNVEDNKLDMLSEDINKITNSVIAVKRCEHSSNLLLQTEAQYSTINSDSISNKEIVKIHKEISNHDFDHNVAVGDINEKENKIVDVNKSNETKLLSPLPEKSMLLEEVSKKKGSKRKKSCPKIKISVTKTSDNSGHIRDSKNLCISERKKSTNSSNSDEIVKQNECCKSENVTDVVSASSSLLVTTSKENNTLMVQIDNESVMNKVDQMTLKDAIPFELADVTASSNISKGASSSCITAGTFLNDRDVNTPAVIMSSANASDVTESELPVSTSKHCVSEKSSEKSISKEMVTDTAVSYSSVKIKEEPVDVIESPVLNFLDPSVNIKEEMSEIAEPLNEVSSVASPLSPSRRKNVHMVAGLKQLKTHPESAADSVVIHENTRVNKKTKSKKAALVSSDSTPAKLSKTSKHSESEISKMLAPVPRKKGKNFSPEAVIVPFSLGWMRELVHRSTEGKEGKRMSDIYYFSPEGTKLRSMPEIANYLSKHQECKLTLENFTFWKECVYREPFEIERSAKQTSVLAAPSLKKETSNQTTIKKYFSSPTTSKSNFTSSKSKEKPSKINNLKHSLSKKSSITKKEIKKSSESVQGSSSIVNINADNSDCAKSRLHGKKIKVPFDSSLDNKSNAPRNKSSTKLKQHYPSTLYNTSVPAVEVKKTGTAQNQSNTIQPSNGKNSLTKDLSQSKHASKKKRPKLKLVLSKSIDSLEMQSPCTPHCTGASIQPPSVQCAICLCMFHSFCIPKLAEKVIFACRPCTNKKLALYGDERKSVAFPDSVSFEENLACDNSDDVDMSLLYPEIVMSMPYEKDTFPYSSGSNVPYKSLDTSSTFSNIPHEQTKTAFYSRGSNSVSSSAIGNPDKGSSVPLHIDNTKNVPCLLSNLLQPNVLRSPNAIPVIRCTSSQTLNYPPTQLTVVNTNDFPSKIYRVGYGIRLPPGLNVSLENSLFIRRLSDGRKVAIRRNSNTSNSRNKESSNPIENPATAVHSSHQFLSNVSSYVNTKFLHSNANQTLTKALVGTESNAVVQNMYVSSKEHVKSVVRPGLSNHVTSEKNGSRTLQFSESSRMTGTSLTDNALYLVFKKLNVSDLLRASQVCSHWKYLALQNVLWKKVSLNGLTVTDWEKCCLALQKFGTKSLDLRGIMHQDSSNLWEDLKKQLIHLAGIEELIFDQITPSLLKSVAFNVPLLRKLECHFVTTACTEPEIWTTSCEIELSPLRYLGRLVRLKIGSGARIILRSGGDCLMPYLPNLRHVALTGFNFSSHLNLESLSQTKGLISLELGDCKDIEPGVYALLGTLTSLKRLRLENGGDLNDSKLSEALLKIKGLEILELMNFQISQNLANSFKELQNLIHVSIWPDNTNKSAAVNTNLFSAISNCKDLKYLCWGIIAEGESIPKVLEMENSDELTFEDLFNKLVALFPECRVEVKCVPRNLWREFCSTRK
ncbi:MBD domain-containing protein [Nephila pilipes]|uniref:MBD domain-containing protein n=1 Tax=Nephila pilipes TaxID=299642 RepID=A0A8X6ND84_NEPPI|nr:MBD domain-containing protein [Nephila pilipes]